MRPTAASPSASATASDRRMAAMAVEYERFLLMQQQHRQPQQQARMDDDTLNAATFDDMAAWDETTQRTLPASVSQRSHAAYPVPAQPPSRVLLDDDGGDEVSLDVVLAGIAAGRDADLLSRGVPLTDLHDQQPYQYYQHDDHYAAEEQLDSSMLDSVLKALEEEEDELEGATYTQQVAHTPLTAPLTAPASAGPISQSACCSLLVLFVSAGCSHMLQLACKV